MKNSDKWAHEYLTSRGFAEVVYEPDGNVPPDFLIDGRIAVEARRFNQHDRAPNRPRGLEVLSKPVVTTVRRAIKSMGPPLRSAPSSWFVQYTIKRPVPPRKELTRLVTAALGSFRDQPHHQPVMLRVSPAITLTLHRASSVHPTFFVLGAWSDRDHEIFTMAAAIRNIQICIAEKTRKAAPYRRKYPEWWLVLEDHISFDGFNASERVRLRELAEIDSDWDKIILVNPNNRAIGFEL